MNEKTIPRATYRLQFNRDLTFAQASRLVPYLAALGISHLYASPCLKAHPGSTHGYDIVDHNTLNPEIGSREEFELLIDILDSHGMGLILDVVPNHMDIGGEENGWWRDVLENGQASVYAPNFDIDWHPINEALRGKVLLPVLGAQYGQVLENGELLLQFDDRRGEFGIRYGERSFPIDPETCPAILTHQIEELAALAVDESHIMTEWHSLIADFERLRSARATPLERSRTSAGCKQRLASLYEQSPSVRAFIANKLSAFNGRSGQPETFDLIHRLLEQQSFRLAYWRVACDEINYRRFFDINELAGLRQENPDVFEATHRLILALVADGSVDGLRIDHPDGLYDPRGYCQRLQDAVRQMRGGQAADHANREDQPLYLVVEKILAACEHLREDWPVHGTTGYAFSAIVNGLFVYPGSERELTRRYTRFIDDQLRFDDVLYNSKHQIIRLEMSSELTILANLLDGISESDRCTRDYTLNGLREALTEVVACFPTYRTYLGPDGVSEEDRRFIEWAVAEAKKRSPAADITIFDFIRDILLLENLDDAGEDYRGRVLHFAMKFQQYTAPVMAKGMEDTAFYVYNRLVSLNEVGDDPRRFGVSPAAFHQANRHRSRRWPQAMLNTSTHDSKRSEDCRARLDVLSEVAAEWRLRLSRWSRLNLRKKSPVDGELSPSPNDEYLLYQTLLAAWPLEIRDETELARFCSRIEAYMLKAIREAKIHTSWINPNETYEEAVTSFVRKLLGSSRRGNAFLTDFLPFQRRMARFGLYNSLSQTLLKLTSPGVPDFYQGSELWTFALVDPDNRQPVDFAMREKLLREIKRDDAGTGLSSASLSDMLDRPEDGRAKLYLIWKALALRQRYPEVFAQGDYVPLKPIGEKAGHLCAFARRCDEVSIVVIASRWFARLVRVPDTLPLGPEVWGKTYLALPENIGSEVFRDIFSGTLVEAVRQNSDSKLEIGHLLEQFPVALLISERGR